MGSPLNVTPVLCGCRVSRYEGDSPFQIAADVCAMSGEEANATDTCVANVSADLDAVVMASIVALHGTPVARLPVPLGASRTALLTLQSRRTAVDTVQVRRGPAPHPGPSPCLHVHFSDPRLTPVPAFAWLFVCNAGVRSLLCMSPPPHGRALLPHSPHTTMCSQLTRGERLLPCDDDTTCAARSALHSRLVCVWTTRLSRICCAVRRRSCASRLCEPPRTTATQSVLGQRPRRAWCVAAGAHVAPSERTRGVVAWCRRTCVQYLAHRLANLR